MLAALHPGDVLILEDTQCSDRQIRVPVVAVEIFESIAEMLLGRHELFLPGLPPACGCHEFRVTPVQFWTLG